MNIEPEMKSSITLWRAVILQAITDATTFITVRSTGSARAFQSQARSWLLTPNAHFNEVCELANLEPSQVRAFAAKAIADADKDVTAREAKHLAHSQRSKRGRANRKNETSKDQAA